MGPQIANKQICNKWPAEINQMTHNSVSNFKFKETLGHCSARFRDRRSFNNKDGLYFIAAAVVHFLGVHRRREELCKNCFSATFAFKVFFTDAIETLFSPTI